MRKLLFLLISTVCIGVTGSVLDPVGIKKTDLKLTLARNAVYTVIFSPGDADGQKAAQELAEMLKKLSSGAQFKVVGDDSMTSGKFISVGRTHQAQAAGIGNSLPFGKSAFEIRVIDGNIYLLGSVTSYDAVMGFLEGDLKCRFFTPAISVMPTVKENLAVTVTDRCDVAAFDDRLIYTACIDKDFAQHNRVLPWEAFRHPNKWFCHTYENITPASEAKAHPELFSSEVNRPTRRHANMLQMLCPTQPGNIRRAAAALRQAMLEYPDKKYFSVSEPDCGIGTNDIGGDWEFYCHCPNCMKLINRYGASIAPHLELINATARAVADRYPKQMIDFPLYSFQQPPKNFKFEPNVNAWLCVNNPMFAPKGNRLYKEITRPKSQIPKFVDLIAKWRKIAPHMTVWEYGVDYNNWFRPAPTLPFLADNLKLYHQYGFSGVMELEAFTGPAPQQHIRTWILAKLLWNPDLDVDALAREYCNGVFGPAADECYTYFSLIQMAGKAGRTIEDFYGEDKFLQQAIPLLAKAQLKLRGNPAALQALELDNTALLVTELNKYYNGYPANRAKFPTMRYNKIFDEFSRIVKEQKLDMYSENETMSGFLTSRSYLVDRTGKGVGDNFEAVAADCRIYLSALTADPKAAGKKIVAYLPCNDNWLCQWVLPTNLMEPGKKYRFSVELRVEQDSSMAAVANIGVFDTTAKRALAEFKPIPGRTVSSGEYRFIELSSDKPFLAPPTNHNDCYLYFSVPQNAGIGHLFINRIKMYSADGEKR